LEEKNVQEAIYTHSVIVFEEFIRKNIVDYATKEAFEASMVANFTVQNVFSSFLGKALFNNFQKAVAKCEKHIMIALDGFDTLSEDFRIQTNFMLQKVNENEQEEGLRRGKNILSQYG